MGVIFVAVTGAAPISAMLFNVPFATGFGTGLYTPAAFLFATVILTIFSVGYVAMARKMRAAGGFYTFISHGLGRELGLAAGLCGALAYSLFEVSLLGGFAYFSAINFNDWFGWEIPWIAFALFAAVLISVLCWFDVELSVRVLGFALIGEIIILAIFDLRDLRAGRQHGDGIQLDSLNVFKLDRSGRRTGRRRRLVPRLLVVGGLRGGTELRGGVARPEAHRRARDADLRDRARHRLRHHVGRLRVRVPGVLADQGRAEPRRPVLRGHARLRHELARDDHAGADPHRLVRLRDGVPQRRDALRLRAWAARASSRRRSAGRIPTHKSPYVASVVQTVLAVALVLAWGIGSGFSFADAADTAYVRIYTMMAVQGVVWLMAIQTVCALAVIVWHRRHKHPDSSGSSWCAR